MKAKEYEEILRILSEMIGEGVHIVDRKGETLIYSDKMSSMERQHKADVIGKSFREVFSHIPIEESTLSQALENSKVNRERAQRYLNRDGKEITTLNTTLPVIVGGEVIAAIEVANDITGIKKMSETIQILREKTMPRTDGEDAVKPEIRKYRFEDIVGKNVEFQKQIAIAKKAADRKTSVFIYGETGTGKELFAQSIHFCGERGGKPFLAQNCAALPETLLEGILFGTKKGGFTGAENRPGLFEQANGGTLLLDEISAMPYELQSKLLRVLQEDNVRRLGGDKDIPIDVRVIATINEPVAELIERGALREDLYYRLAAINIKIPALRERADDISLLAQHLLSKQCKKLGIHIMGFTANAMRKLREYDYPGNVRELENIIASAVSLTDDGKVLDEDNIEINPIRNRKSVVQSDYDPKKEGLPDYMGKLEKSILKDTLATERGNISKAAAVLGIKRQTLQHKIKKYEL